MWGPPLLHRWLWLRKAGVPDISVQSPLSAASLPDLPVPSPVNHFAVDIEYLKRTKKVREILL